MTFRGLAMEDQRARWRDPLHTIAESIRRKRERLGLDELDHNLVVMRREASIARFPRGSIGMVPVGRDELVSLPVSLSLARADPSEAAIASTRFADLRR